MSDTPWTKGPWDWDYDEHDHQNAIVWLSYDANMRVCFVARCDDVEQTHANARLIAAAPDLYEALKAIMDDVEPTEFALSSHIRDAARSALAKARGETS